MPLKMCEKHWEKCKVAIKERGLWHLVPEDGQEAMEKLILQTEDPTNPRKNYDPLMNLNLMITAAAIQIGGLRMMMYEEDTCPLCIAEEESGEPEMGQDWIDSASDAILEYCEEENIQG